MTNQLVRLLEARTEREATAGGVAFCDSQMDAVEAYTKYFAACLTALLRSKDAALAYRYEHALAHSSGPGEWADAIADLAPSASVVYAARDEGQFASLQELTQKASQDSWQYSAYDYIRRAYAVAAKENAPAPKRVKLIDFFSVYAALRNKLDAHGAPLASDKDQVGALLADATPLLSEAQLLQIPGYVVRVDAVGQQVIQPFAGGPVDLAGPLPDGTYFGVADPAATPLVRVEGGPFDLLFANGGERKGEIEYLSYATGTRARVEDPVAALPSDRVVSETAARQEPFFARDAITTAPSFVARDYVEREELQEELMDALVDERRLVITLQGGGGTGKTALALWANDRLSKDGPFDYLFWLSARDIDLSRDGAVNVSPDVLSLEDVAAQIAAILETDIEGDPADWLAARLQDEALGPTLWVFDNFETFEDPAGLYNFIYRHVDRPHTVLITSRHRTFTGDRAIEVGGMTKPQFEALVQRESGRIGLSLVPMQIDRLYDETLGHPYVAKLMLGEIKYGGEFSKVERVLAGHEGLLSALFERTFTDLSDEARLAFLALCEVKSLVLETALEMGLVKVLPRRAQATHAIRQILDFSLANTLVAPDRELFLEVPASARAFGHRHVRTDALATEIAQLKAFLSQFTPTKRSDLVHGGSRVVDGLVANLRRDLAAGKALEPDMLEPLLVMGDRYPGLLARTAEVLENRGELLQAENLARRYCSVVDDEQGWLRLARIREELEDDEGALDAWIKRAEVRGRGLSPHQPCCEQTQRLAESRSREP